MPKKLMQGKIICLKIRADYLNSWHSYVKITLVKNLKKQKAHI